MCDNTCHFVRSPSPSPYPCTLLTHHTSHQGLNSFFADNGLSDAAVATRLYFPADAAQMHAVINKVLFDKGLRFVFSTRSKVPYLLKENSNERYISLV